MGCNAYCLQAHSAPAPFQAVYGFVLFVDKLDKFFISENEQDVGGGIFFEQ